MARITTELNVAISEVRDELQTLGAYSTEQQLETLRTMWRQEDAESLEREAIERVAYAANQESREYFGTTAEQLSASVSSDAWREDSRVMDYIDSGYYDKRDVEEADNNNLPTNDSDWLSWKVNKFIKGISHRTKSGSLYIGRVRIGGRTPQVENGYFEFRCYSRNCQFHGKHYVGGSTGQVQVIISMILAHYYKHA